MLQAMSRSLTHPACQDSPEVVEWPVVEVFDYLEALLASLLRCEQPRMTDHVVDTLSSLLELYALCRRGQNLYRTALSILLLSGAWRLPTRIAHQHAICIFLILQSRILACVVDNLSWLMKAMLN